MLFKSFFHKVSYTWWISDFFNDIYPISAVRPNVTGPEGMTRSLAGKRRAEATAPPGWIKPQRTRLVDQRPDGPALLHELKYDGYRMHARLDRGAVRL